MKKLIISMVALSMISGMVLTSTTSIAKAASENVEITEEELVMPGSYEEYLMLNEPTDISVTENYTAISDENSIYIYNRQNELYSKYTHTKNTENTKNNITKIEFSEDETLYFLDASTKLYKLNPETLAMNETELFCSFFTLYSDQIYFTSISSDSARISQTSLNDLNISNSKEIVNGITSKPVLTEDNGVLYYTDGGKFLKKLNTDYYSQLSNTETVTSMVVYHGILYYLDTAKSLYIYDIATKSELKKIEGNYTSLTHYDGYIYAIDGNRIRQYHPIEENFTNYEIGSGSSSPNRIKDGNEMILNGDEIIIADNGNNRILVYNTKDKSYRNFPVKISIDHISTDGKTIMVSNKEIAVIYNLLDGSEIKSFDKFNSNLVGVTGNYGDYYLITDNNYFYKATYIDNEWKLTSIPKLSTSHTARLITQDVYGDIYTAFSDGSVYKFTEDEYMDENSAGTNVGTIQVEAEKMLIDYECNIYTLFSNEITKYTTVREVYNFKNDMVYGQNETTKIKTMLFGTTENTLYLLYENNFIVKTNAVPIPNVKEIATENISNEIFSTNNANFSIIEIDKKGLLVGFDISALKGETYFPYTKTERTSSKITALNLGKTDKYNVIAIFNEEKRSYTTALVLKKFCNELPESEYLLPPTGFNENTGFISNEVNLYKYPYLTDLLTINKLNKNTKITILGEINKLDYPYYYVSYLNEKGEEKKGYIPKNYALNFNPTPKTPMDKEIGGEKNKDIIWRMVYMLLGFATIFILIDYMIIKKRSS